MKLTEETKKYLEKIGHNIDYNAEDFREMFSSKSITEFKTIFPKDLDFTKIRFEHHSGKLQNKLRKKYDGESLLHVAVNKDFYGAVKYICENTEKDKLEGLFEARDYYLNKPHQIMGLKKESYTYKYLKNKIKENREPEIINNKSGEHYDLPHGLTSKDLRYAAAIEMMPEILLIDKDGNYTKTGMGKNYRDFPEDWKWADKQLVQINKLYKQTRNNEASVLKRFYRDEGVIALTEGSSELFSEKFLGIKSNGNEEGYYFETKPKNIKGLDKKTKFLVFNTKANIVINEKDMEQNTFAHEAAHAADDSVNRREQSHSILFNLCVKSDKLLNENSLSQKIEDHCKKCNYPSYQINDEILARSFDMYVSNKTSFKKASPILYTYIDEVYNKVNEGLVKNKNDNAYDVNYNLNKELKEYLPEHLIEKISSLNDKNLTNSKTRVLEIRLQKDKSDFDVEREKGVRSGKNGVKFYNLSKEALKLKEEIKLKEEVIKKEKELIYKERLADLRKNNSSELNNSLICSLKKVVPNLEKDYNKIVESRRKFQQINIR